jgi:hypothetical protein
MDVAPEGVGKAGIDVLPAIAPDLHIDSNQDIQHARASFGLTKFTQY